MQYRFAVLAIISILSTGCTAFLPSHVCTKAGIPEGASGHVDCIKQIRAERKAGAFRDMSDMLVVGAIAYGVSQAPQQNSMAASPASSLPGSPTTAPGRMITRPSPKLCPDGSYVGGGDCILAPDGSYVNGQPTMAPDGSYTSGSPRITPKGNYIGGSGQMTMCPDGSYVIGNCRLAPNGRYVGN